MTSLNESVSLFYTKMNNYSAVAWREQATYQWDDDDVCFVLDKTRLAGFALCQLLETTVRGCSYVFILQAY